MYNLNKDFKFKVEVSGRMLGEDGGDGEKWVWTNLGLLEAVLMFSTMGYLSAGTF